jgi:hypothetical protein
MANWYVWSGATGTGDGTSWTNAFTLLTSATANAAAAAGDTYFVAHDHVENNPATSLDFKGTANVPDRVFCVDRGGSVPPVDADLRTTAVINLTATVNVGSSGAVNYFYGIIFNVGVGSAVATRLTLPGGAAGFRTFERCQFNLKHTAINAGFFPGGYILELLNCSVSSDQSTTAMWVLQTIKFRIRNDPGVSFFPGGIIIGGGGMLFATLTQTYLEFIGVDFTPLGSSAMFQNGSGYRALLHGCKLPSPFFWHWGVNTTAMRFEMLNCYEGTNFVRSRLQEQGAILDTENSVVRSGGASDGTTPYSWKITGATYNTPTRPFQTYDGVVWNDYVGVTKTLTVHVLTDGVTLNNNDIWVEAEYFGTSGSYIPNFVSDAPVSLLATVSAQDADAATWNTSGLASPVAQKLVVQFTPWMTGLIRWRVKYAKSSGVVYVDPLADIT